MGQFEFSKEPRQAMVENGLVLATGFLPQGAGEPGFADTARAGNHQITVLGDPAACRKLLEERLVEFARRPVIHVLNGCTDMAQPG